MAILYRREPYDNSGYRLYVGSTINVKPSKTAFNIWIIHVSISKPM